MFAAAVPEAVRGEPPNTASETALRAFVESLAARGNPGVAHDVREHHRPPGRRDRAIMSDHALDVLTAAVLAQRGEAPASAGMDCRMRARSLPTDIDVKVVVFGDGALPSDAHFDAASLESARRDVLCWSATPDDVDAAQAVLQQLPQLQESVRNLALHERTVQAMDDMRLRLSGELDAVTHRVLQQSVTLTANSSFRIGGSGGGTTGAGATVSLAPPAPPVASGSDASCPPTASALPPLPPPPASAAASASASASGPAGGDGQTPPPPASAPTHTLVPTQSSNRLAALMNTVFSPYNIAPPTK